jgi:predicted nucleic-acid-binding Zn-ribbon protein
MPTDLAQDDQPHFTHVVGVKQCARCGYSLVKESATGVYQTRRVRYPTGLLIEYRAEGKNCPKCGKISYAPLENISGGD